jgi:oligopeptidase B
MRAYLRSYSPYDNVPPLPWPSLLVTGSVHDSRVLIKEPAKWVARLRAAAAKRAGAAERAGAGSAAGGAGGTAGADADRPLLFRAELGAGAHMGPTGRYEKLGYEAEVLAFIVTAAGMPEVPAGADRQPPPSSPATTS